MGQSLTTTGSFTFIKDARIKKYKYLAFLTSDSNINHPPSASSLAIFKSHTAQPYFTPISTNTQLVWEGPSCLKCTYTKIYILYTHMIIYVCIYTLYLFHPTPLSFNFHFPVSIVAFQCHTLKLQDRIHLNIAVAGPTSTLALRGCGLICFHIFCTWKQKNSRQLGNLWCFHLDFQHPRVERCRKWF